MKLPRTTLGLILPLCLGTAAFRVPQPQEEKKPEDNRPSQPTARPQQRTQPQPKPQEQPRQESRPQPHPQEQPRPQGQQRTQPQSRPHEQPKPNETHAPSNSNAGRQESHPQPHPQEPSRAQEQQRTQPQSRTHEQPKPNGTRAPSNSNAGRQEQPQPSQPNENRSSRGSHETVGGRPQQNPQQRARIYSSARRVPQTEERSIFQERRASNWGAAHRDWRSRGGYVGFRIPDSRFGLYFGRAHYFHLWGLPMVYVGGYPEFQYQGYWFELLDPVPPDWAPNWYQTDQVYIDWDSEYGGYYLYDTSYPDERLAVEIAE